MHNQPFRGIIDDLTLSGRTALTLESLTLSPSNPRNLTATVRLAVPAPPGGAEVKLAATVPGAPASVTIPAGKSSSDFTIPIRPDLAGISVTATYNGSQVSAARSRTP